MADEDEGTTGRRVRRANPLGLVPISHYAPEAQSWVWESMVPMGLLTTVAGAGGSNKSTLIADMCAKLTLGTCEGDLLGTPVNVMYLTKENDPNKSMRPKMIAAGADVSRLFVMGGRRDIIFPDDTDALLAHADATDTRIIVLDPMLYFLNQKRSLQGNYGYAVEVLTNLMDGCGQRNITVIGITHLVKGKKTTNSDSQVGSVGIATTARQVLMVGGSDEARIVGVTKSNVGPTFIGWRFAVEWRPIGMDKVRNRHIRAPHVELIRPANPAEIKAMFEDAMDITGDARVQALLVYIADRGTVDSRTAQHYLMSEFRVKIRSARITISKATSGNLIEQQATGQGKSLAFKLVLTPAGQRLLEETDDMPDPDSDDDWEAYPEPDEHFEAFGELPDLS